jgi:uncharacterized integral membrane protein
MTDDAFTHPNEPESGAPEPEPSPEPEPTSTSTAAGTENAPAQPEPKPKSKKRGAEFEEQWQPKLWSKIIILTVVGLYGIALIVANGKQVAHISLLVDKVQVSTIYLVLACFLVGLVCGVLSSQLYRHRKNARKPKKH